MLCYLLFRVRHVAPIMLHVVVSTEATVRRSYHDPRPPPIATIGWEKPAAGPWEITYFTLPFLEDAF